MKVVFALKNEYENKEKLFKSLREAAISFSFLDLDKIVNDGASEDSDDLKVNMNKVLSGNAAETKNFEAKENYYVITDCEEGTRLSAAGYIFVENSENRNVKHENCQCIVFDFENIDADFVIKMYQRSKGQPWIICSTDRLIIREHTLEDVEQLYELYEDEEIKRFCPELLIHYQDRYEFEKAYIKSTYELSGFGMWVIERKLDGKIIGRAGIFFKEGHEGLELGYLLGKEYRGKGYAFEACKSVLKYAYKELIGEENHKIIYCYIDSDNTKSIKLARKLGDASFVMQIVPLS